jgi:formamidopyrimidine-DNA glycosylase
MPELPDVTVYVDRLAAKVVGRRLERLRIGHPFLLRSVAPPISAIEGRTVDGVERLGKRVVLVLDGDLFVVVHLMIAGRLVWLAPGARTGGRNALAWFEFDVGTLALTEAGKQRRASLHIVDGRAALRALDAGGIDVMTATLEAFTQRLTAENHTVKRSLTDPRLFSGIGNAYSDEILHRARMSPLALTQSLDAAAIAPPRRDAGDAERMDGAARARGRRLAGQGHGLPSRDGGARPLRPALPRLRRAGAAHRPRRQRDPLLRALPDQRQGARRPRPVAAAQGQLAEAHRRADVRRPRRRERLIRAGCAASRRSARGP